ncbi:hypothetical protein SAY87_021234 [Trapa incisa]|uniref:Uncharacterized protein n=1 Tax=Trapa incisa TaxID=236973 RepID=A0AAN7JRG4_9MYRT|nr:hypothetical protein SAY87_021234 [Trapa incisa]
MESTSHDNRKCALDALERRFAVAKAEFLQQQKKKEIGPSNGSGREVTISSKCQVDAQGVDSSSVPARKDVQEVDPIYTVLSQINENLLAAPVEISNKKRTRVDRLMHELLQRGNSAQKYMQGSRSMKLDSVILLDNYVKRRKGFVASRTRALLIHSKRSKIHMSMKKLKKCGSFDLSPNLHEFHHFVPMHEMWKKYMIELLKTTGKSQIAQCVLTADLHGAVIQVANSKVTSFIGANGIMIRETARTFGIITRDNKFRVVPKKDSVFLLQVDCWKITLHGEKLIGRDLGL